MGCCQTYIHAPLNFPAYYDLFRWTSSGLLWRSSYGSQLSTESVFYARVAGGYLYAAGSLSAAGNRWLGKFDYGTGQKIAGNDTSGRCYGLNANGEYIILSGTTLTCRDASGTTIWTKSTTGNTVTGNNTAGGLIENSNINPWFSMCAKDYLCMYSGTTTVTVTVIDLLDGSTVISPSCTANFSQVYGAYYHPSGGILIFGSSGFPAVESTKVFGTSGGAPNATILTQIPTFYQNKWFFPRTGGTCNADGTSYSSGTVQTPYAVSTVFPNASTTPYIEVTDGVLYAIATNGETVGITIGGGSLYTYSYSPGFAYDLTDFSFVNSKIQMMTTATGANARRIVVTDDQLNVDWSYDTSLQLTPVCVTSTDGDDVITGCNAVLL